MSAKKGTDKRASGNLGKQYPFREPPEFKGLLEAIDVLAKRKSLSRNLMITRILARHARDAGVFKPPEGIDLD